MAEPDSTATITSRADYDRNEAIMDAMQSRIRKQAVAEKWSSDRLEETLVDELLPYFMAKTDPASQAASAARREEYLDYQGKDGTLLEAAKYPELTRALQETTKTFNAYYNVNYSPPQSYWSMDCGAMIMRRWRLVTML